MQWLEVQVDSEAVKYGLDLKILRIHLTIYDTLAETLKVSTTFHF